MLNPSSPTSHDPAPALHALFQPASVAVIGASRDPSRIGARLLDSMLSARFQGALYPVNPKAAEIQGLKAWPSVRAIPGPVDLAVVAVPRQAVLEVVTDCADKGVRAVVVITADFAETGPEGRAAQDRLVAIIRERGLRLVGPNCFGLLNTHSSIRLNATFGAPMPPHGPIAIGSQSGALGLALLATARRQRIGISTFVSMGNKADVSTNDLLEYWEQDPASRVILLYLESFGNPRRFAQIARRVGRTKPIVALKAGRSTAGRRAAGSHTAALAANEVAVEALFRQAGVIHARTLDELFAIGTALAWQPLPRGRRVAIVTNAGGAGILLADACEEQCLTVAELAEDLKARLGRLAPQAASLKNPVDLIATATPDHYRRVVSALLTDDSIDALIACYVSVSSADSSEFARALSLGVIEASANQTAAKPLLACWMAEYDQGGSSVLREAGIPVSDVPEVPARVLAHLAAYAEWRRQPAGAVIECSNMDLATCRTLCRSSIERNGPGWLRADETHRLLLAAGFSLPAGGMATTADQAVRLARAVGFPIVAKLASRRFIHKSDVDGVRLNLRSEGDVRALFREFRRRFAAAHPQDMDGLIIQPMLKGGVEVMAGMTVDPQFGPLFAFGLGGIYVEILGDVQFRLGPLTDRDAMDMLRGIKGARLLDGYRGHPPADVTALVELLQRLSRLVEALPDICELDLNPIFAFPPGEGYCLADARIRVGPPAP
jgi:acetyl coenzyme A synthetase (ADP forming)-like protein